MKNIIRDLFPGLLLSALLAVFSTGFASDTDDFDDITMDVLDDESSIEGTIMSMDAVLDDADSDGIEDDSDASDDSDSDSSDDEDSDSSDDGDSDSFGDGDSDSFDDGDSDSFDDGDSDSFDDG
ncbi:MAG TPA: hypothetical protein QF499_09260, partial [Gammaproteobacteria bacterium]|nr:hypothetical protein [Gammaproteobacteria bacterium]